MCFGQEEPERAHPFQGYNCIEMSFLSPRLVATLWLNSPFSYLEEELVRFITIPKDIGPMGNANKQLSSGFEPWLLGPVPMKVTFTQHVPPMYVFTQALNMGRMWHKVIF